jgi:hypothetical protein
VVAALVVGGGVTAGVLLASGSSGAEPDKVALSYLTALSKGDAATALKAGPAPASTTFLTNEILAKQQAKAKIGNIKTGKVETRDDQARVPVTYTFGIKEVDDYLYLRKSGGKWLMAATVNEVDGSDVNDIPGLTLFGKPVPNGKFEVFPGPLEFGSGNANIAVDDQDAADFSDMPGNSSSPVLDATLSPAGKQKAIAAVTAKLSACAKVKSTEPTTCPQKIYDFEAVNGTATWKITSNLAQALKPDLDTSGGQLSVHVSGEIDWSVTYRAKDFDNKATTRHDTDSSYIDADVDLSKSPPTCTLNGV